MPLAFSSSLPHCVIVSFRGVGVVIEHSVDFHLETFGHSALLPAATGKWSTVAHLLSLLMAPQNSIFTSVAECELFTRSSVCVCVNNVRVKYNIEQIAEVFLKSKMI